MFACYERVSACLSVNRRWGPIWGVSKQAGESHAGCSLGSVLMEFNPNLSYSRFPMPNHYGLANFSFALCVCLKAEREMKENILYIMYNCIGFPSYLLLLACWSVKDQFRDQQGFFQ